MKNVFSLIGFSTLLLVSCSTEESPQALTPANESLATKSIDTTYPIMEDLHGDNYEYSESILLTDDLNTFTVTEFNIPESDNTVYLVEDEVNDGSDFYVNFNWASSSYISIDLSTSESVEFEFDESFSPIEGSVFNLFQSSFDDSAIEGRFWGWQCGPAHDNPVKGYKERRCCYRIMWMRNHCKQARVGFEPGNNPRIDD